MIWLFITFAVGVTLLLVSRLLDKKGWKYDDATSWCVIFGTLASAICAIMVVVCIIHNADALYVQKRVNELNAEREALIYQMENGFYLGDSLSEYNSKVQNAKLMHENPWTSWFIGDYIMDIELIDIPRQNTDPTLGD